MKREFDVIGLDCGHCALTLEKYIEKVEGVNSCNINFSTSKLFIDIDGNDRDVIKNVIKTAKQVNPTVKIINNGDRYKKSVLTDIIMLIIGIILGVCVIFLPFELWLKYTISVIAVLIMGYKTFYRAIVQLKTFKINENTLILISVFGAIVLGEIAEGMMVIALYTLGKLLESKAVNYSRKSISNLISTQPDYAYLVQGDNRVRVKPEEIRVGQTIVVSAGEKVAVDGVVVSGSCYVDKRHLSGESEPIMCRIGDSIESGSIVLDSVIEIEVTAVYQNSTVAKILSLVSDASNKKSKTETVVSKFTRVYTLGVMILSTLVFLIVWLVLADVDTAIYRGLVFLVVSCPCAFAISVPLTYFSGIGKCSSKGILVKGSNFLDVSARLDRVVFDKTGTITTGKFAVKSIECEKNIEEGELVKIVASGEKNSLHPVAVSICEYYNAYSNEYYKITAFKETAGKGIEFKIKGSLYTVSRGDRQDLGTCVVVKKNQKLIGKIYLEDKIKDNINSAIACLNNANIKTTMLTGDNEEIASSVSRQIGIGEYQAGLLPEDKYNILQSYKDNNETIAYVGDGINDAPALTIADVGISMGIMGSDASIETSDIVLVDDDLGKISKLIQISKKTKRIALGNIIFAGITKLTFLVLGAMGITGMLFAVFADVGVTLISILNSLRVLLVKDKQ